MSTSFVRAQSLCLLNRLEFLGEGVKESVGRRDLANILAGGGEKKGDLGTINWLFRMKLVLPGNSDNIICHTIVH